MATLDRLREIVRTHRPSSVPVVDRRGGSLDPPATPVEPLGAPDHARAALELGGAVVEHSDGAVIVVDREYRADMLHGRLPIGDIVSTISDGDEAMRLMAQGVAVEQAESGGPPPLSGP
jgi:hypothetical protein